MQSTVKDVHLRTIIHAFGANIHSLLCVNQDIVQCIPTISINRKILITIIFIKIIHFELEHYNYYMTEIILDIYEQHERARSYHNRTLKKMLVTKENVKHSLATPIPSFNTIHNNDDDNNNQHIMQENTDTNFKIYDPKIIESRLF
jgi:hypothetical protein